MADERRRGARRRGSAVAAHRSDRATSQALSGSRELWTDRVAQEVRVVEALNDHQAHPVSLFTSVKALLVSCIENSVKCPWAERAGVACPSCLDLEGI